MSEPAPAREPAAPRSRWRSEPWLFLELFALCGFVVVQPMLDIVGSSPDFFIFHGVGAAEILAFVAITVLVPPAVLWLVGALVGLAGARARQVAHVAAVAGLLLLLMIQVGKQVTEVRGVALVALAAVVAALIVVGYLRLATARQVLRFAAVGPLVFVLLFTFASPASAVVLTDGRSGNGGAPQVTGPHPPIVMIVLDEFSLVSLLDSDGGIDGERFPHFARLASESTWYRNATTNAGWTPYALPSMLRGEWPAEHAAPHYAVYPDNLFTLLGEVYEIHASESISELCPPWYCSGTDGTRGGLRVALTESTDLFRDLISPVDPAREPYDDFAEPTLAERQAALAAARREQPDFRFEEALGANQPARFHDFMSRLPAAPESGLASDPAGPPLPGRAVTEGDPATDGAVAEADRPPLHFLHLLLPHTPWKYLPDGTRYPSPVLPLEGEWWGRLAHQRYLAQLAYTDRLLGETLDQLEASGLYDEALVVVTADHGVPLTPGNAGIRELSPDAPGIGELAWVPMFIKEPGQTEGVVEDGNWQHVDLLPTVADYAGVAVPWSVEGISWRREERTSPEKIFYPELDQPGVIDGPAEFAKLLADPAAIPPVPPAPLPELVGAAVATHPVVPGDVRLRLSDPERFARVDPASGVVPALVRGTVPDRVPLGTPVAIAVNGRIGAVVPVTEDAEGERRFAGLVADPRLFRAGENQVELFLVPDGVTLRRA